MPKRSGEELQEEIRILRRNLGTKDTEVTRLHHQMDELKCQMYGSRSRTDDEMSEIEGLREELGEMTSDAEYWRDQYDDIYATNENLSAEIDDHVTKINGLKAEIGRLEEIIKKLGG